MVPTMSEPGHRDKNYYNHLRHPLFPTSNFNFVSYSPDQSLIFAEGKTKNRGAHSQSGDRFNTPKPNRSRIKIYEPATEN